MHARGLSTTALASAADFERAVAWGAARARRRARRRDAQSSRSHAIWTLAVRGARARDGAPPRGRLRIVDLAGSERRRDTDEHSAERMEETKHINLSLGCLKECVRLRLARAGGDARAHIPFRRSKLTMLLKECFEDDGGMRTVFVSHLSPLHSSVAHTLNTLDYTVAMIEATRAERERAKFEGPEKWSRARVRAWVEGLAGGRYKRLAPAFATYSGKALSVEYRGDVSKKVEAFGGSEADAFAILDAFHELLKAAKKELAAEKARAARRAAAAAAAGGGGGGGEDDDDSAEAWRARFVAFYESRAPDKAGTVDDAFMAKWAGRYDELYGKLRAKYGEPPAGGGGALADKMARDRALLHDARARGTARLQSVQPPRGLREGKAPWYSPPTAGGWRPQCARRRRCTGSRWAPAAIRGCGVEQGLVANRLAQQLSLSRAQPPHGSIARARPRAELDIRRARCVGVQPRGIARPRRRNPSSSAVRDRQEPGNVGVVVVADILRRLSWAGWCRRSSRVIAPFVL